MGRPPISAERRKGALVQLRLTDGHKAELARAAAGVGLSLSSWLLELGLKAARSTIRGGKVRRRRAK